MTPREISERLFESGLSVCKHLLPNGKKNGHEWEVGSVHGESGKSMKVSLSKNVWSDFASGEAGDYLNLWMAVNNCDMVQAMNQAQDFLGIHQPKVQRAVKKKKKFNRPSTELVLEAAGSRQSVESYLGTRGITKHTINAYRVGQGVLGRDPAMVFPSMRDGQVLQAKRIGLNRNNGKKKCAVEKDCEPCLFGWQAVPKDCRIVVITEGEIDALSWFELDYPALSVPFGGGEGAKQDWIEYEYENLQRFDEIYISMDEDDQGQLAAQEIVRRLGPERCRIVHLPFKDANECLQNGVSSDQMLQFLTDAETLDPAELRHAGDFMEQTISAFHNQALKKGFDSPFMKHQELVDGCPRFYFRESEVTIVNGVNGHGKSELVGQLTLAGMRQGYRAVIASMELKPEILLKRLTRQASAAQKPSPDYIKAVFNWYADKLFLFNLTGTAKASKLLEIFLYANRRYGCKLFVIDSLLKCGIGEDDYNGQKLFVEKICDFVNETDSHVLLVTHPRKAENEATPTGKMDVRGSGSITDLVDNVFVVWRNKNRERLIEKQQRGENLDDKELDIIKKPGSLLISEKQREGEGWNGVIGMHFDTRSHLFLNSENDKSRAVIDYSATRY